MRGVSATTWYIVQERRCVRLYKSVNASAAALKNDMRGIREHKHMSKDEWWKNLVRETLRQHLRQLGGRCVPGALINTTERARISIRVQRVFIEAMRHRRLYPTHHMRQNPVYEDLVTERLPGFLLHVTYHEGSCGTLACMNQSTSIPR